MNISYLLKRLLRFFPMLWIIATLVFFSIHIVPGDPVEILLGESANDAQKEALKKNLHLDMPLGKQYIKYWKDLARGDLGVSIAYKKPIAKMIRERLGNTLLLAFLAISFSLLVAIPLGCLSAVSQNKFTDKAILLLTILGASFPTFWIGPLLICVFSILLGWLPVSEKTNWESFILPTLTISIGFCSLLIRVVRTNILEVIGEDYIRTAHSKGLSFAKVLFKHTMKNALIPVVSIIGIHLGGLLAGAVVTESIFDWPGIGDFAYRAIQSRDFPAVQGCVLVIATTYLTINLLSDIFVQIIDPRVQFDQSK